VFFETVKMHAAGAVLCFVQVMERRGIRCKQLLDDIKEKRRSWKLK
jgi:hypothetical protein